MIKHIIFDLGNVILDQETLRVRDYFLRIFDTPKFESDDFFVGLKRQVDSGEIKFKELLNLYEERFHVSMDYEDFIKRYQALYLDDVAGLNPKMMELVKSLRHNYSLYIMSNTVAPHFEAIANTGFTQYFNRVFRSDTDHFVKPETQAYEYVLKEIGAKGQECVFVDDLEINVKGAEAVGITGIVFKNPKQLVEDLKKIGVTI
jgi:putative hydrolase of the HAD superfamily